MNDNEEYTPEETKANREHYKEDLQARGVLPAKDKKNEERFKNCRGVIYKAPWEK